MNVDKLQDETNLLIDNIKGWETYAISLIAKRVKKVGEISASDKQSLKNIYQFENDIDKILKKLSLVIGETIPAIEKIYKNTIIDTMTKKKPEYIYRALKQVPYTTNKKAQSVVKAFTKTTSKAMLNLSKTKAINIIAPDGKIKPFAKAYREILDKAVYATTQGLDFNAEMRNTIKLFGGGGVRVDYGKSQKGKPITRRTDTVIRQNILWGAKQASQQYDEDMGEELNADGFEVSYHSNPRKSHVFMGGVIFAKGKARTIDGVYYPSGDKAEDALNDYGCLHDSYTLILGVSEPAYNKKSLEKLKEQDEKEVEFMDKKAPRREWKVKQREIETQIRRLKDQANALKASGDVTGRRETQKQINKYQKAYNELIANTGLEPTKERMSVAGFRAVKSA